MGACHGAYVIEWAELCSEVRALLCQCDLVIGQL